MEPKGSISSFFKEVIDAVRDELKDCKEVYFDKPNSSGSSSGSNSGSNSSCGQTPNNSTFYSTSSSSTNNSNVTYDPNDPKYFDKDLVNAVNDIQLQVQDRTLVYTCSFNLANPLIKKDWIGFYNYYNAPSDDIVAKILMSEFVANKLDSYRPVVVDYNRDYVVKYWSFNEARNDYSCTRYGYLNSEGRMVLLGGELGEQMFIKWSHFDKTSGQNFVTIHSTTGDGNAIITQATSMLGGTMLTNQGDSGYFKTSRINDGLKYYAVMWGSIQNGNSFIRLAISKPIEPIKRNLSIVEVPSLSAGLSMKLGIYVSEPTPTQSGEYVFLNQGKPTQLTSNLGGELGKPIPLGSSNGFIETLIDSGKPKDLENYYGAMVGVSNQEGTHYLQDSNSCKGYTTWMTDNWQQLQNKKFRETTLAGSRDIGSSYLNENSKRSPFATSSPSTNQDILLNWSIHQTATITRQLEFGIRYFNIQVAPDETGTLWIANDMLCIKVEDALKEFYQFHKDHESSSGDRNEIIFLHWNKIDRLSDAQHQQLMSLISSGLHGLLGTRVVGSINSFEAEFHSYGRTPFINFYDDGFSRGSTSIDHLANNIGFWYATDIDINFNEDQLSSPNSTTLVMNGIVNQTHSKYWILPCYLNVNLNNLPPNQSSLLNWTNNSKLELTEALMKFERLNKRINIIVSDFTTFYPLVSYSIRKNLQNH